MSFLAKLLKIDGGMTKAELSRMTSRSRFSNYLPWMAYDPETKVYINQDNTAGFAFECNSVSFAGEKQIDTLEGLFRLDVPEGTVMQFILFADPQISHYVERYKGLKVRDSEVVQESAKRFAEYMYEGVNGLEKMSRIPVRDYRLFVTFKFPFDEWNKNVHNIGQIKLRVEEILIGARLYPYECEVGSLIDWMRRLFNDREIANRFAYDEDIPLNKQVISFETEILKSFEHLKVGNKYFKCLSPKLFPQKVNPLQTNMLFGGIYGIVSDMDQITTPYMYTLNIIFENLKTKIHTKCNLVLQQQAVGSFAPSLMRKKEEYMWSTDELEKGTKFFRIMPVMWVFSNSEKGAFESAMKVKRIWEQNGYIMQEDKGILDILFISSLPFGLYNVKDNINNIERDFIAPSSSITPILPVQTDFSGGGIPHIVFVGRKGQICSINLFDKDANNANSLIVGTTGSGKSFFVNYLCINEYGCGSIIRIVDIGGSYKKLISICNARYLKFSSESQICINPFTNVKDPEIDIPSIANIACQMAYSASDGVPDETESTLIKSAVEWAYNQEGNEASIDTTYEYLKSFPEHSGEEIKILKAAEDITIQAHTLAFNMKDFTKGGIYGKYFSGKSGFDISSDEFVVLELEHIVARPDLFKVITQLVITAVTQDLYLSDRSRNRLIVFDEFWQYGGKGKLLASTCESAYRRVRKYGGGIAVITQDIMDIKQFGELGQVLLSNSAFKFYLESSSFEKAKDEKILSYDEFTMEWLKTLKSSKPNYSEIFVDSPFGRGIVRLTVDPYSYYVYTSDAKEVSAIENLIKEGMTYNEAIIKILKKI